MTPAEFCDLHHACREGKTFAMQHATLADVWDQCKRPDWMLWILSKLNKPMDDKTARLFTCWCVRNTPLEDGRTTWDLLTDERSRNAVIVSERFANSEASENDLAAARAAARAAAGDAARAAAGDAAWAAALAAALAAAGAAARAAAGDAAWAAARAAALAAAGDAAWTAARAAARDAAWAAALAAARAAQCNRIREVCPNPFLEAK